MTSTLDLVETVAGWHPPEVETVERIDDRPANAFAALMDQPPAINGPGDPLPPLWHWFYFLDWPAQAELGADGHPADGVFLPPIPNRRRMFAGGRLRVHQPLRCGDVIIRRSRVTSTEIKDGRSGTLLFVTVSHEFHRDGTLAVAEEQDLVYRSATAGDRTPATAEAEAPPASVPAAPWQLRVQTDPALLFRFSALTANAHRIHYDLPYTRDVEGFPGLVVHGPLLALYLLELPRRYAPDRPVRSFRFRAQRPVLAGEVVWLSGHSESGKCIVQRAASAPAMTAQVDF